MPRHLSGSLKKLSGAISQANLDRKLKADLSSVFLYINNSYQALILESVEQRMTNLAKIQPLITRTQAAIKQLSLSTQVTSHSSHSRARYATHFKKPVDVSATAVQSNSNVAVYDALMRSTFQFQLCLAIGKPLAAIPKALETNLKLLLLNDFFDKSPQQRYEKLIAILNDHDKKHIIAAILQDPDQKYLFKNLLESVFYSEPDLLDKLKSQGYYPFFLSMPLPNKRKSSARLDRSDNEKEQFLIDGNLSIEDITIILATQFFDNNELLLNNYLKKSSLTVEKFLQYHFGTYEQFSQYLRAINAYECAATDLQALTVQSKELCKELLKAGVSQAIVEEMCCPLSGLIILNPVYLTTETGEKQYFEKAALEVHFAKTSLQFDHHGKWIPQINYHPFTKQPLPAEMPILDSIRQTEIAEFIAEKKAVMAQPQASGSNYEPQ